MMKLRRFLPLAVCMAATILLTIPAWGQETTGALAGTVTVKSDRTPLPGVAIEAVHVPTGTRWTSVSGANGRFVIVNVRVGGPYTVTAKLKGFKTETQKDIMVALGEQFDVDLQLEVAAISESVSVTAELEPLISPDRMGSAQSISQEEIKALPTIRRQFQDFARTNPYVNLTPNDPTQTTMSVSGKNNRYNTIQIDGAVNNDLFGLAATGTPGGQTDTQPISLDAIQELQVVVSPYDVKQGGFTGGAINAVTRGGTNDFHGSVYGSTRSEKYIGSDVPQAGGVPAVNRPIATFSQDQYGARLGGPILRDRLFFFGSAERNKLSQPTGGSADGTTANVYSNPAQAAAFKSILVNKYGYDPGGFGDFNTRTNSDLLFGRLDVNAGTSNQVTLRYNYVDALSDINGSRNSGTYVFETGGYTIADKTNSFVGQVNSVFGTESFNEGRVGYQTIRDSRQVPVQFPSVYICAPANANTRCSGNGAFQLGAGTERSSGANSLDQDILEITDNFTLIKGNHTITVGTHNEIFKFKNLFIQDIYGTYYFNTVADFDKGVAQSYQVGFGVTDPRWIAEFGARQWGVYAGDQWRVSNKLTLNLGLRFDLPQLPDKPTYNPAVYSTYGIDTSNVPTNQLMVSPRLGFNWNPTASGKDQFRGGIGIFAGRTPFVWLSNNYGNTGVDLVNQTNTNVTFTPDINNPPKGGATAAITVNGVNPDFKFPQILRSTLAYDRELPGGLRASVEYMFTKTLYDIFYYNLNRVPDGTKTTFWGAPVYKPLSGQFSDMIYLDNTKRGEQQNLSVVLEKRFPFGLYLNGSYAYMNAKAAFEGTSSVAFSNWQFQTQAGDIYEQALTRSFWDVPWRFQVVASQLVKTGPLLHNFGLVYTAQAGQPYSLLMGGNPNNDGGGSNDLLFIPNSYNDVVWKGAGAPTQAQWDNWVSMIGADKYLGRVMPRNAADAPSIHTLDFHYDLTLPISIVNIQLTFDVLNLINLIDHNSGLIRYVSNQTYQPLAYSGIDSATGKPIYTVNANALAENRQYSTSDLRSRYQLKFGGRISF